MAQFGIEVKMIRLWIVQKRGDRALEAGFGHKQIFKSLVTLRKQCVSIGLELWKNLRDMVKLLTLMQLPMYALLVVATSGQELRA